MIIHVKVVPGASRDRVAGRYGEGIKVQVSAPPERGKANEAVVRVLADFLGVRAGEIELIAGHGNPRKQFRISGLDPAALAEKIAGLS